jgi:hypothetical protein
VGLVELLPRRRVSGRGQSGGADGRARTHHQWELCRIHSRAGLDCRPDRVRSALG